MKEEIKNTDKIVSEVEADAAEPIDAISDEAESEQNDITTGETASEQSDAASDESVSVENASEEKAVTHEDNLELHNLRFFERQRAKRAKLKENMKDMTRGQKFGYILSYYKGKIILGLILLAICIALPVTIYKKSRPVAISYCIVNAAEPDAVNTDFVDDYRTMFGLTGAYQVHNDLTVHLDKETYLQESQGSSASVYTELPMLCFNGYYDIMILDEKGLEYCAMQEIIYPLKNYLPADIYSLVEDRLSEAEDHDGVSVPFAIDISDTEFAKHLNLGYDKVYLGFPGNSERNYINSKRMIKYALHLDIDTETSY